VAPAPAAAGPLSLCRFIGYAQLFLQFRKFISIRVGLPCGQLYGIAQWRRSSTRFSSSGPDSGSLALTGVGRLSWQRFAPPIRAEFNFLACRFESSSNSSTNYAGRRPSQRAEGVQQKCGSPKGLTLTPSRVSDANCPRRKAASRAATRRLGSNRRWRRGLVVLLQPG